MLSQQTMLQPCLNNQETHIWDPLTDFPVKLKSFKKGSRFRPRNEMPAWMKAGQARRHASAHAQHYSSTLPTRPWISDPSAKLTRFLGGRLMSEDCGVPDSSYKHTLQTAAEWVHPKWECPTRKRLNQLLSKRECIPFPPPLPPSLGPHSTAAANTSPPPRSLWDLVEEIHLCPLAARLVSANRSK